MLLWVVLSAVIITAVSSYPANDYEPPPLLLHPCPPDSKSLPPNSADTDLNDPFLPSPLDNGIRCVCDPDIPCPAPPACTHDQNQLKIATGSDKPGYCCPQYTCHNCTAEQLDLGTCPCGIGSGARLKKTGYSRRISNHPLDGKYEDDDTMRRHGDSNEYVEEVNDTDGDVAEDEWRCECEHPGFVWDGEQCQCDRNQCRLEDLCFENSVPVRVTQPGGCCVEIKCIECPMDSVATVPMDSQIEAKCVCQSCQPKACSENEIPVIKRRGLDIPNRCCDLYVCTAKPCTSSNGTNYGQGAVWRDAHGDCKCQNGIALCSNTTVEAVATGAGNKEVELLPTVVTPVPGAHRGSETKLDMEDGSDKDMEKACYHSGTSREHLETWIVDQCTNCTCRDGHATCIAHMCEVSVSTVIASNSTKAIEPKIVTCDGSVMAWCRLDCDEQGYVMDAQGCEVCECKGQQVKEDEKTMVEIQGGEDVDDDKEKDVDGGFGMVIIGITSAVIVAVAIISLTIYKVHNYPCKYKPVDKSLLKQENNNNRKKDVVICESMRPLSTSITTTA